MPRRSKKHCHAFSKDAAPDLLLVGSGNPSYRDQAHATVHPTCPCHCLVTLATRSPGRGAPCSPQEKNATVMLVPLIHGRQWNKLEAVAEYLFGNLGRGIPYQQLIETIGRKSDNATTRSTTRIYVDAQGNVACQQLPLLHRCYQRDGLLSLRTREESTPYRSVRRDEGASEMGRRVRQLRIAAGLTQTALAKRFGMDRTHLSRLERGRLMPTFPTLKRLAKTLQVTPRSLL